MEADTFIPPHVLLSIQECILQVEHAWNPDRHNYINSAPGLGVARLSQCHDNVDSLNLIERERCKFVGVLRKTWINSLLSLHENYQIFDTIGHFEERSISTWTVDDSKTLSVVPVSVNFNPLRAKFFRVNINIYLYFMPFLHNNKTQVVQIPPRVRQGPAYST